jgi:hypothetical protein
MYCNKNEKYCAHGRNNELTCYSQEELLNIAENIEQLEGKPLKFKRENLEELWKDIHSYMKTKHNCRDELCWVETLKLQYIEKNAFKPIMPSEWLQCDTARAPDNNCMNTWLSNYEIDNVLGQFEQNVDNFEYLGSVPIDFANFPEKKVNTFKIKNSLANGKNKIGVVFNTDPSYRRGQHWICAFIDLEKKEINFFDSYGSNGRYPEEIQKLFDKILKDAKDNQIILNVKLNLVRHQQKDSECGVYCIKFIADRINSDFETLTKTPIPDDLVNRERWTRFFRVKNCRPFAK